MDLHFRDVGMGLHSVWRADAGGRSHRFLAVAQECRASGVVGGRGVGNDGLGAGWRFVAELLLASVLRFGAGNPFRLMRLFPNP